MDAQNRLSRRTAMARRTARWVVLVIAIALAWPPSSGRTTSVILPALSPYVAICAAIASHALSILVLFAIPVLVLSLVTRRWFCSHACPVGLMQEVIQRLRPRTSACWVKCPALGHWLLLLTVGGAFLGYPLFLWLDPLAIFNGFLNAWRRPVAIITLITGLGLPLLLLLELAIPRLWCRRICPLGAAQDLLARRRIAAVPGRRWFLAGCAGAAGALAAKAVRAQSLPPLRPPGSLRERQFMGTCVRCGNCAQACPARIIHPSFAQGGIAGLLTPHIRFDTDYCREDCNRCNLVCPSGAIARLSLTDKRSRRIGVAVIDLDLCLLAAGRECTACIQKCPYQALRIESPDGGFSSEPRLIPDRCNGCGACQVACPTQPKAIRIAPIDHSAR